MNRFLRKQLLNIVFLVLIVAGALTIYFLSRAERKADTSPASQKTSAQTSAEGQTKGSRAAPAASSGPSTEPSAAIVANSEEEPLSSNSADETDAPAATASAARRPRGVPESVFTTHLATSDLFDSAVSAEDSRLWTISYGDSPAVTATLQFTVDNGAVSSLEFFFPLAPEYDKKSDSAIEQYLAGAQDQIDEARAEAIRALLTDLLPACDLNDALSHASVRLWAEEALRISSEKDDYIQKAEGCSFLAYQTRREGRNILVCLFFLES